MELPTPRRRQDLLALGVPSPKLDNGLRSGRVTSLFRGVHVDSDSLGGAARRRAALMTQGPAAVLSHQTAAAVHGLRWLPSAWTRADAVVQITVPGRDKHRQRAGMRLHRTHLDPTAIVDVGGQPCTSVPRTLVDLARSPLPRLLVVQLMDGALGEGRCTLEDLYGELRRLGGKPGVRQAAERVGAALVGVDSPPETEMRLVLVDGGITGLRIGVPICDDIGHVLARADLADPDRMLWGEYDGFDVHVQRATFRSDRAGDRWLERRGWHVMRFTAHDLRRPAAMVREWATARANAPMRILAMSADRSPELAAAQRLLRCPPANATGGPARRGERSDHGGRLPD
jgi:hypothetical protein